MNKIYCSKVLMLMLAVLFTSCVKDVILDAMEDPQLVVNCVLTVNPVQELKLSYTKSASRSEAPRVTGATAVLTDLTEGRESGRFTRIDEETWQLEYAAIPTHDYRLEVTVPDRDPVWAEQTMPMEPPVESFEGELRGDNFTSYETLPKGIQYKSNFPCTIWAYAFDYDYHWEQREIVENICTNYPNVDNFNLTGAVLDTAIVQYLWDPVWKLNKHYNSYLAGYPVHRRFLRFQKLESPAETWFLIDGHFSGAYYYYADDSPRPPKPTEGILYFACLSDEYDKYLCEAFGHYHATLSSDLSSIYVRDNVYTNINGGIGIFGAITTAPYRWESTAYNYWDIY